MNELLDGYDIRPAQVWLPGASAPCLCFLHPLKVGVM